MIKNLFVVVAVLCSLALFIAGGCGGSSSQSQNDGSLGTMTVVIRSKAGQVLFSESRQRFPTHAQNGQWANDVLMANYSYINPSLKYVINVVRMTSSGSYPYCGSGFAIEDGNLKDCASPFDTRSATIAGYAYPENQPGDIAFLIQEK